MNTELPAIKLNCPTCGQQLTTEETELKECWECGETWADEPAKSDNEPANTTKQVSN